MPALSFSKSLIEHSGSLSLEVNLHEPKVAETGALIPSPTVILLEGRTSGPNYGDQVFSTLAEADLDDDGKAIYESKFSTGAKGSGGIEIIRSWDGNDFEEQVTTSGDFSEQPEGYRRTIDDETIEVKFQGEVYIVKRIDRGDGAYLLRATRGDGLSIFSQFDHKGRIIKETTRGTDGIPRTATYRYNASGALITESKPGNVYSEGSSEPDIQLTMYDASQDERLVTVTRLPYPGSPDNWDRLEKRNYNTRGQLVTSNVTDGFVDIGRLMIDHTFDYAPLDTSEI